MRRLLAAWVLAVLVVGCTAEDKKPADPPPEPKPNPAFDKTTVPKGAKKASFG
jgi:hypothetical protein